MAVQRHAKLRGESRPSPPGLRTPGESGTDRKPRLLPFFFISVGSGILLIVLGIRGLLQGDNALFSAIVVSVGFVTVWVGVLIPMAMQRRPEGALSFKRIFSSTKPPGPSPSERSPWPRQVDTRDDLVEAARHGDIASVQALLDKGADVNARDERGCTALMWASMFGYREVAQALLDKGADVGYTLKSASQNGHLEIVKALLMKGADVRRDGGESLIRASENGHLDIVKMLLAAGVDVSSPCRDGGESLNGGESLIRASVNGHLEIVKVLLDQGVYVNTRGRFDRWQTPLLWAAANGHVKVVEFLRAKGGETFIPDVEGNLHSRDFKDAVEYLGKWRRGETGRIDWQEYYR